MTIWKSGMRCVCVDDRWEGRDKPLLKGTVYTVKYTEMSRGYNHLGWGLSLSLILEEVVSPEFKYCGIDGFDARRFRPLSETRLDQFRVHLAPTNREKADA